MEEGLCYTAAYMISTYNNLRTARPLAIEKEGIAGQWDSRLIISFKVNTSKLNVSLSTSAIANDVSLNFQSACN